MTISFTVCSANYMPYAKSLADSLVEENANHRFVVILLDRKPENVEEYLSPHQLILVEKMEVAGFAAMNARYNIFELSCAMKSFAADYLFRTFPACSKLFYFDSDILVYGKLSAAEKALDQSPILLTPHLATDNLFTDRDKTELDNLRTGIYNAGFFALSRHTETQSFLNWWMDRMQLYCFNDARNGLFVDQLWLNLVPLSFPRTLVFRDSAYNVAYWNFGERKISAVEGRYFVNNESPLVFYHFSGHDIHPGDVLCKHFPFTSFETNPEVKPLFEMYKQRITANAAENDYADLEPAFGKKPEAPAPIMQEAVILPAGVREKNFFKRKYQKWFKR